VISDSESSINNFASKLEGQDASAQAVANSFKRLEETIPRNAYGMIESMHEVGREYKNITREASDTQSLIHKFALEARKDGKLTDGTLKKLPELTTKIEELRKKLSLFVDKAEQYANKLTRWADGATHDKFISRDAFDKIRNACSSMKLGCQGMQENVGFIGKEWNRITESITRIVRDKTQLEMDKQLNLVN